MKKLTCLSSALLSLSLACGPETVSGDDGDSPTGTSGPAASTGASTPGLDSSTGAADTGNATTTGTDPGVQECDLLMQDCPDGQKCTVWASDGGNVADDTRCVPVAADPGAPGDPCEVERSANSGLDDCELGSYCWGIDPLTLQGECIAFCFGDEADPECDSGFACSITGSGPPLCFPTCNPLQPDDCPSDQSCHPSDDDWFCFNSSADGGYGEPCDFVGLCAAGLACVGPENFADCKDEAGCCADLCSLDDPMCSGAAEGAVCQPWYDDPPKGYEDLGVCIFP